MKKVTDPNLLKELNSEADFDYNKLKMEKVTDPNLLSQLNSEASVYDNTSTEDNSKQGLLSSLLSIPYNLAVGAGGGIQNLGHGILPKIIPEFKPQGIAQNIGNVLGNVGSFSVGGEALGIAGHALPIAKNVLKYGESIPNIIKSLGSSSLYGAINEPENRLKGAETGLMFGAAAEALPYSVKGLGKLSEFINPKKYANDLSKSIMDNYKKSKIESAQLYKPVIDKLGNEKIVGYPYWSAYKKLGKEFYNTFPAKLYDVHKEFVNNPTLNNAHILQSRLGKTISSYISKNEPQVLIDKLKKSQENLKSDINNFLIKKDNNLYKQYKGANIFYKKNVIPYLQDQTIGKISSGNIKTISPKKLQESLRKLSEKENIVPENHTLNQAFLSLSNKINTGKVLSDILSLGSGAAIGYVSDSHVATALASAIGGALGMHYGMPKLLSLSTNPKVVNNILKLQRFYDPIVKGLINAQTGINERKIED